MAYELPELPYSNDALAPVISAETIEYHYGKHHAAYVANLNKLVPDGALGLEELISSVAGDDSKKGIFNNAAQVWNHTFYWNSLSPNGGGAPTGAIAAAIDKSFGSFDQFKMQFSTAAATHFGSGWTWLVKDGDGLAIETTANADTPIAHGKTPLLTLDVWEHAYYVDYRNARPKYVEEFWKLVNWDFANKNL